MEFNFYRLKIWQKAHLLALEVYKITRSFPRYELYGIVSQLRRSVVSIAANIVEGYSRKSRKEFIQFLYQSRASLDETIYFLILSRDLGYISVEDFNRIIGVASELMKMLNSFITKIKLDL
jgi:four helix bundle protein